MEQDAIKRVWEALVAVDSWLHDGFITMLNQSAKVEPAEWVIVHQAAQVLREEQLAIPSEIYALGMAALQKSLQPNANVLLDQMRGLLAIRATGNDVAEAKQLQALNDQIQKLVSEFRQRLLQLKAVIDGEDAAFVLPDGGVERISLSILHDLLSDRFSDEELRTLCLDLNIDYDDLPALGKSNKARELITYLARRSQLDKLLTVGLETRPDVPWQEALRDSD
ncbi:hypothetical protein [Candidatus Leptofilum sp.]|uniref:hypothetical protein n=1 Tax=Candidatus Leptofilum sp. TaxID=3241576 RepID=UPI003B5B2F6E